MASLRIDDLPDTMMKQLKAKAKRMHRPIGEAAKLTLVSAMRPTPRRRRLSVEEQLARAKAILDKQKGVWITVDFIEAAINEGRP